MSQGGGAVVGRRSARRPDTALALTVSTVEAPICVGIFGRGVTQRAGT